MTLTWGTILPAIFLVACRTSWVQSQEFAGPKRMLGSAAEGDCEDVLASNTGSPLPCTYVCADLRMQFELPLADCVFVSGNTTDIAHVGQDTIIQGVDQSPYYGRISVNNSATLVVRRLRMLGVGNGLVARGKLYARRDRVAAAVSRARLANDVLLHRVGAGSTKYSTIHSPKRPQNLTVGGYSASMTAASQCRATATWTTTRRKRISREA